jgi:hypothetical protein
MRNREASVITSTTQLPNKHKAKKREEASTIYTSRKIAN